ncbi:uncharacterized protein PG986_015014 [Apiospora aurea]|uniref:Uncharacterized protein n=1 Tax=Apiospora aurea TaxID=335848 RepID=A0ABR1PRC0_9PEZI
MSAQPVVHFGHIAPGDSVIKSGEDRDIIAHRDRVIAFEMESAGVWDIFPCCLEIKGACNYAHSHETKPWQHYAAATAAACMKALLDSRVPAQLSAPGVSRSWIGIAARPRSIHSCSTRYHASFSSKLEVPWAGEGSLEELEQRLFVLHDCRTLAITELGGVGKTQVGLQFAYWVKDHQPDCSASRLRQTCGSRSRPTTRTLPSAVRTYLSSAAAGDDAEMVLTSPRRLSEILPRERVRFDDLDYAIPGRCCSRGGRERGSSTRNGRARCHQPAQEFPQPQKPPARYPDDSHAFRRTDMPAIGHYAGGSLSEPKSPRIFAEIPGALAWHEARHNNPSDSEFEDTTRYWGSHNAVATAWIVSFNQLQEMDPGAASLLSFISCIEPKDIPRPILPPSQSNEILEHTIGTLCGYSFLVHQETSGMFDMHRLVHIATKCLAEKAGAYRRGRHRGDSSPRGAVFAMAYERSPGAANTLPACIQAAKICASESGGPFTSTDVLRMQCCTLKWYRGGEHAISRTQTKDGSKQTTVSEPYILRCTESQRQSKYSSV